MTVTDIASPRAVLSAWLRAEVAGADEVHVPDLVRDALDKFKHDPAFLEALAEAVLPEMVAEMARSVLKRTRFIELGDDLVTPEQLQRRVAKSPFRKWMEHAGDRHYRLTEMTREQLAVAIGERSKALAEDTAKLRFLERLHAALEPGQTVGARFTDEQLKAEQEAAASNPAQYNTEE